MNKEELIEKSNDIKIMKKVFLGGTCNGSNWRNQLIPMLEINYFNPVVEDWTPKCMKEEIRQRGLCNLCLYVITPKMTGVYSIAEAVDDSNKRANKTVFVMLRTDEDKRFNKGQWTSLLAVAKMVNGNGSMIFDSLKTAAKWMNNTTKGMMNVSRRRELNEKYNELNHKAIRVGLSESEKLLAIKIGDELNEEKTDLFEGIYNTITNKRNI